MRQRAGCTRVLVVADIDEERTPISRALSADGYQVDAVSSLTAAKSMDPAGYDVVLVEAMLGADRGTELVEMMQSADPAAVTRCLVITGAGPAGLPAKVAALAKPFRMEELVEAVHRLGPSSASPVTERRVAITHDDSIPRPAPDAAADAGPAAVRQLLDIVRGLRVRERTALADLLHDVPIQELAAAALELGMVRGAMGASEGDRFDMLQQRVDAASRSLRCLLDELWSFPYAESSLAKALTRRTAWLLATPLIVNVGENAAGLLTTEISVVANIVELILLGTVSTEVPMRALAAVRADEDLIFLELNLSPAADTHQPFGDQAPVRAWLDSLSAAIRICADTELSARRLRTRIGLPRQPHS